MAQNVPTWFAETYTDTITQALAYRGSKFRGAVMEKPASGEQAVAVDLIGQVPMKPITQRLQPIINDDFGTNRVWMRPQDFYSAPIIDTFDKLRLDVADPQGAVVTAATAGAATRIDEIIATAFFADQLTGRSGATPVAFSAAHQVANDVGAAAASGLNAEKVFAGLEILQNAEVDVDNEEIYLGISPADNRALLAEARVTNGDFMKLGGQIENGKVTAFAGAKVIISTKFAPLIASDRHLPLWVQSGMHLGVWSDVKVSISQRNDIAGEPYQVHVSMTFGATRTEPGKVVRILAR